MQDIGWVSLEPADLLRLAVARDQREAGRVVMQPRGMDVPLQQSGMSLRIDQFFVTAMSCGRRGPGSGIGT